MLKAQLQPLTAARGLRASLVLTWLLTALVSTWEWSGMSAGLLREAGLSSPGWIAAILMVGIAVDVVVGVALWWWPGRWVYRLAMLQVVAMTVVATWLLPALWMHPLGPLLKNLPILALLRWLEVSESS